MYDDPFFKQEDRGLPISEKEMDAAENEEDLEDFPDCSKTETTPIMRRLGRGAKE